MSEYTKTFGAKAATEGSAIDVLSRSSITGDVHSNSQTFHVTRKFLSNTQFFYHRMKLDRTQPLQQQHVETFVNCYAHLQ
jgi:hypothetical protein